MSKLGTTVLFTFHDSEIPEPGGPIGESRTVPATVTKEWADGSLNLLVFADGVPPVNRWKIKQKVAGQTDGNFWEPTT